MELHQVHERGYVMLVACAAATRQQWQKNHDQVSLPEGKSRKQASTYLGLVSRAQEYFSYNPEKQKREKSLYLI